MKPIGGGKRSAADRQLLERALEALVWCGGSGDFAPEGKAAIGWQRLVTPVIDEISRELGHISEAQRRRWFERVFPGPEGALTGTQRRRRKAVRS